MNRISLLCALVLTLADVAKPVVVDDTAYLMFARQIVDTPAHIYGPPPIGASFHWYQHPIPAFEILCPPVVPYWLALGIGIFGESIPLLKLWMFPFAYLFARSIGRLLHWLAPASSADAVRSLMLAAIALSPVFLPALNLMLDIPALGLGLAGIAAFVGGLPRPGWRRAIASGLLLGLAMQTKYSTLLLPAVIALTFFGYGWRTVLPAIVCIGCAIAVFVAWEAWISHLYGRSHFLFHSNDQTWDRLPFPPDATWFQRTRIKLDAAYEEKSKLVVPLFCQLGMLAPGPVLLAWLALGMARRWLWIFGVGFLALGFVGLIAIPPQDQVFALDEKGYERLTFSTLLVTVWSASLVVSLGAILTRLHSRTRPRLRLIRRNRAARLLTLWLMLEIFGFFMLTPFPASRRLMGTIVVVGLIVGRLLMATARSADSLRTVRWMTAAGLAWAAVFGITDIIDARLEKVIPERVALDIRTLDPDATVWFCGHWGTQYYGERAGMRVLNPDRTTLKRGDYLAIPGANRPSSQEILIPEGAVEFAGRVEGGGHWRLRTIGEYYGGNVPIHPHRGIRMTVDIYRVVWDFVPQTDPRIYD